MSEKFFQVGRNPLRHRRNPKDWDREKQSLQLRNSKERKDLFLIKGLRPSALIFHK